VFSSTPEAASSFVLDSHRPSLRTSHTPSKVNSHAAPDLIGEVLSWWLEVKTP
jgi:hypothetical protein